MSAQTHHHTYESRRDNEDTGEKQQRQPDFPFPIGTKHPDHWHRHAEDRRIGNNVEYGGDIEILRLEGALIARIRYDLPVLLDREAATGERQEDGKV